MNEKGFEGLKVWQKAHGLMLDIHTKLVPAIFQTSKDERFPVELKSVLEEVKRYE